MSHIIQASWLKSNIRIRGIIPSHWHGPTSAFCLPEDQILGTRQDSLQQIDMRLDMLEIVDLLHHGLTNNTTLSAHIFNFIAFETEEH